MTVSEIVKDITSKEIIHSIFFVACGGSLAACWPSKYFLETEAKRLKIFWMTSNEFVYAVPAACDEHSIVVACSLRGTPETVKALRKATELGAYTVAFTGEPSVIGDSDYALASAGKYMVSYRNLDALSCREGNMLKIFEFSVELLHCLEGYSGYEDMQSGLEILDNIVEKSIAEAHPKAEAFAEAYADDDTIYIMGSGPSYGTAYAFSICSLMEISWIHSPTVHTGEYFHGPFETTQPETAILLLKNDGATRFLDERVEQFLSQQGGRYQILDAKTLGMNEFKDSVREYFNGIVISKVLGSYLEQLSIIRKHHRSVRRYMWQV